MSACRLCRPWVDMIAEALKCTPQDAPAWFYAEVEHLQNNHGINAADAVQIVQENLGYASGYCGINEARKVYELFGAVHPVFGTPEERERLTSEQIFEAGYRQADGGAQPKPQGRPPPDPMAPKGRKIEL
jgi:hypothetical protein